MEITDLDDKEQLALVGLLRLMIKADEELSDDENARVVQVRDAMGNERFQAMATLARKHVRARESVTASMAEVTRPEAKQRILAELEKLAESDGLVESEKELLAWVRTTWKLG